ncbi:hypothetical protein KAMAJI_00310 [Serratia phage vB_SmaM-Kamaji]|nr:hypothetical protein KAMAJI_00310 [Serratia phage vB_SmaM-Kamaji]
MAKNKVTHVAVRFQASQPLTKLYVYRVPIANRYKVAEGDMVVVKTPGGELKLVEVRRTFDENNHYTEQRGVQYKDIVGVAQMI